ncbi:MAG: DUF6573 family protein [Candidatus Eisenbacteria bacterium]
MNTTNIDEDEYEHPIFGKVIDRYTRAQAIEDGVLIDVTAEASETGFRSPVAITAAAHALFVATPEEMRSWGQSDRGRLHDVLWMCYVAIRNAPTSVLEASPRLPFQFLSVNTEDEAKLMTEEARPRATCRLRPRTLHAHAGPDDDGRLCITIMLPEEY